MLRICKKCGEDNYQVIFDSALDVCRDCKNNTQQLTQAEYYLAWKDLSTTLKELIDFSYKSFNPHDYKQQVAKSYIATYGVKKAVPKVVQLFCDKYFPEGINRAEIRTYSEAMLKNWRKLKKSKPPI